MFDESAISHELLQFGAIAGALLAIWRLRAAAKADTVENTRREERVDARLTALEKESQGHRDRDKLILAKLDEVSKTLNEMATTIAGLRARGD